MSIFKSTKAHMPVRLFSTNIGMFRNAPRTMASLSSGMDRSLDITTLQENQNIQNTSSLDFHESLRAELGLEWKMKVGVEKDCESECWINAVWELNIVLFGVMLRTNGARSMA
jgi:hypothetical protein